jgi:hypothetical protein
MAVRAAVPVAVRVADVAETNQTPFEQSEKESLSTKCLSGEFPFEPSEKELVPISHYNQT